ncbi:hypothetical protein [Lysinibacillus sphaericus]|uniref:hypothetical protein n=1 Tax=Lysinibacillus sphaericus TaxID=1421 RepID=UPI003D7F9E5F
MKKEYPLCFPIMNCPEQIEPIETNFNTLIRIKLKDRNTQNENSISHQLEQPFYKSLLFLPNISKILITVDGVQQIAFGTAIASMASLFPIWTTLFATK